MLLNELHSTCLETMLMVDPDLFSNMVVPDGVEKGGVVACIRRLHGLAPLYHPDPYWMKQELYWWSRQNLPIWKKLFSTTQLDYNPIWNTDMSERSRDVTSVTRDTSQNVAQHSNGGAEEQAQHADDRHQMETTGNIYHEHTKDDGFTTDTGAATEKTVGSQDGKKHGFAHTQTEADDTRDTKGTLDRDTTGTRLTTHNETMTDKVKTTKDSQTDVEGKVSAENEATYQPFDASTTIYKETGTADETRETDWTENENTSGTQDDTTTEHMTDHQTSTSDTETKEDTSQLSTGLSDSASRAHGTHGDTGSTDGHGHTERQAGDRGTAQDTKTGKHDEHSITAQTGKENVTTEVIHEYTKGGNIGVTTTQQMIEAERETVKFDIYRYIADSWRSTFCLDVY